MTMSTNDNPQMNSLFSEEKLQKTDPLMMQADKLEPVICLGMTFESDDARREYFRDELRKKLPELKQIEGFPIGEDEDIIKLSDPPYYTACPNPWTSQIIEEWEEEKRQMLSVGKRIKDFEVSEPYMEDISVGKNDPIYMAHSYHTKVPHKAIMKLLSHYTQPGDITYDGFAGTGMAGVAAGMCTNDFEYRQYSNDKNNSGKRFCICSDLSPIASFIAYNLNNNSSKKIQEFPKLLEETRKEYSHLYRTLHTNGKYGEISYMVWSDIVICEHCNEETPFMSLFCKIGEGKIEDEAFCPHCGSTITRRMCAKAKESYFDKFISSVEERVKSIPYLIVYTYENTKYRKTPDEEDLLLIKDINNFQDFDWLPIVALSNGDKMDDPKAKGITYVHQLYSERTLYIISKLWSKCSFQNRFFITSSISRNLTKLNRFILNKYNPNGRINGPLSGTLYVPSEVVEQNVFDLLDVKQSNIGELNYNNIIQVGDALHNYVIPDESIDYIFTDPPFGANIMYSELNQISEAWLGILTNNQNEAICNKTQRKTVNDYMGLMTLAFQDYYRVLKPGKWMTVEFSNTKASVWNAIQNAIQVAGFIIVSVTGFDKVHGGQKSMRYTTAVKEDLIITCFKPSSELSSSVFATNGAPETVWNFVSELLHHLPIHIQKENKTTAIIERDPKILYDRMIAYYVQHGYPVPLDAHDFQEGLRERYKEIDGMFFTYEQAAEYLEKKKSAPEVAPMGLIVSDEANGIQWLKNQLMRPQTYQEIQPEWMQAIGIGTVRKNDIIPELKQLLEENFIEEADGKWRLPNIQDDKDLEALRTKALLREFKIYVEAADKPKARIKEARVEALRAGFKQCYVDKDFETIVKVGNKIPENLRDEDEVLLQFYDIALNKM